MRILTFSDIHLEFQEPLQLPSEREGDVLVLAGDIGLFKNFAYFDFMFSQWKKPILFVAGNHEFYGAAMPMSIALSKFKAKVGAEYPHVKVLNNESVNIADVQFFGGTMWTDFAGGKTAAMHLAQLQMNDYRQIQYNNDRHLTPADTIKLHNNFVSKLVAWFEANPTGKRVVISHHAPAQCPTSLYKNSSLSPAFNSLDMIPLIEKYAPDLWIYGHTHECDDQTIGNTRIISNQRGYPTGQGGFESKDFDKDGLPVIL